MFILSRSVLTRSYEFLLQICLGYKQRKGFLSIPSSSVLYPLGSLFKNSVALNPYGWLIQASSSKITTEIIERMLKCFAASGIKSWHWTPGIRNVTQPRGTRHWFVVTTSVETSTINRDTKRRNCWYRRDRWKKVSLRNGTLSVQYFTKVWLFSLVS